MVRAVVVAVAVVVSVLVTLSLRVVSAHKVLQPSPYCRKESNDEFDCTFSNAILDVVVGGGPMAEVIASQYPVITCPASSDVSNDSSVNKDGNTAPPDQLPPSTNGTVAHAAVTITSAKKSGSAGARRDPRALHMQEECKVNISFQNTRIRKIEGQFVTGQFNHTEVVDLGGVYTHLDVKRSLVSNASFSGKTINVEDAKIEYVSRLGAERCLNLRRTDFGTVAPYGLQFLSPGSREADLQHTLSSVAVQELQAGSVVVVGARVSITNMTIGNMVQDAITVMAPGMLNLTNVMIECYTSNCLKVETGARLILRNVTLNNTTVTHMDLRVTSETSRYPLSALVFKDNEEPLDMTFPWYWLVIMTVCGMVAGMMIGSALTWKRPTMPNGAVSTFTLSDLLSHDRLQENNEEAARGEHTTDCLTRPTLNRQDSGLTSSSFASYMPFQKSRRTEAERGITNSYSNAVSEDV